MAWQPRETLPRDETVLVTVIPAEVNKTFREHGPRTHAAYIDERGRICDVGTWKPDPGLDGDYWRTIAWQPLPAPADPGEHLSRRVQQQFAEKVCVVDGRVLG